MFLVLSEFCVFAVFLVFGEFCVCFCCTIACVWCTSSVFAVLLVFLCVFGEFSVFVVLGEFCVFSV